MQEAAAAAAAVLNDFSCPPPQINQTTKLCQGATLTGTPRLPRQTH
jgi:hypothetical protein